jgi:hypothetical protein
MKWNEESCRCCFSKALRFCSLSLASLSRYDLPVEVHGLIPGHAQRSPPRAGEVPCQQDDLSHMKPIMRHLAVDSLYDRVGFAADGDRSYQIGLQ